MRLALFGIGQQGRSPNLSSQRRLNLFYEVQKDEERTRVSVHGTPGLELFADFGDAPVQGDRAVGNYLYVIHRGTFWRVDNAGVKVSKGTLLTTSGRCSLSDNGTQIMIVDGTYGYIYNTGTDTFAQITDGDFPGAETVTFNDGYFIVNKPSSGRVYISAAYDGLTWASTDYKTAESNPDNTIAVWANLSRVFVFGDISTEVWGNTGATDFPYSRIVGGDIGWGLAARWSVAPVGTALAYLARNRNGEVSVVMLQGYDPTRISDQALEYEINGYSSVSDATAFSYMQAGHPFYQINFPNAGKSWLYDASTQVWSELKSKDITRHRAEIGERFINDIIVSDYSNGRLYKLKRNAYTDNGEMIEREIIGKHFFQQNKRTVVRELTLDMETGIGLQSGQGSDPQVMLSVSKDGGNTWGPETWKSAGKAGEYRQRVVWRRLGRARDFTFKVRITDPVPVNMMGAWIEAEKGNT